MKRRMAILIILIAAVGGAYWLFQGDLTLAVVIDQERRWRELVAQFPWTSALVGFVLYLVASLIPGTAGKAIIYGWVFGFWVGLLIVNFALTLAAILEFLAIRYALQDVVHAHWGTLIKRADDALRREGTFYLLTLRLLHAPFTLMNYTVGATTAPLRTFWWTTQLGILPSNIAFVVAGSQLPSLQQVAERGPMSLVNLPLLIGLSLTALIPVIIRWAVQRVAVLRNETSGSSHGKPFWE